MRRSRALSIATLIAAMFGVTGQANAAEPTGMIKHHNQHGAMCLDSPGHANYASGTRVILWNCHGGPNQQWAFITEPDGSTLFEPDRTGVFRIGGKCLDAFGGSTAPGTPVILWDCHGGPNQRWTNYGLRGLIGLTGQGSQACIAPAGSGATVNGTELVIRSCEPRTGFWALDKALVD